MKKRKLWIPIVALLLAGALAAGYLLAPRMPKKEAAVYPVLMVGYTDYYSGVAESYGMVTTDKVQTIYLTGTQTVTESLVYPGQTVKKGDVLYTYDTTLSDLAVERKDLANQQLEMELKNAQAELAAIKKMKPIVYKPGTPSTSTKVDYTKSPSDKKYLDSVYSTKTTGKYQTSPLYFWLKTNTQIDDALIAGLYRYAEENSNYTGKNLYVVFQMTAANKTDTEFSSHIGIKFEKYPEVIAVEPPATEPPATEPPATEPPATEPPATEQPAEPPAEQQPDPPEDPADPQEPAAPEQVMTADTEEPTAPSEPVSEPAPAVYYHTVDAYKMSFFTPPSAPKEDSGTVEWNDGYTSAELSAMKKEKEAQIKQLQFDIKMGKAELKIMKKEADDGQVLAQFSGVVSHVLDPAQALETGEPMLKVTGGGGYYVEGTISELSLNTICEGQSITVNSWDTGMIYTGKIVEIGSYPVENQNNYYGGSGDSYYPYRVFIDESADLMEGYYVSMTSQTEEQAAGILYIQNAFLRSEGNRTYVLVRGVDGLLEKRYIGCGVSTDGHMTPVYSGITEEDYLAFPYGSQVTEGAPTFEGTDQDLYGY